MVKEANPMESSSEERVDMFCSLRFGEAMDQARSVQEALKNDFGLNAVIIGTEVGNDIFDEIVAKISAAKMVIIFGSETYGRGTAACFSTKQELQFVQDENKPFFLIKMCERFAETRTRMTLNNSVMYELWMPGTPMPDGLISKIVEKFNSVKADADK
jgi:hypothetical protein